MIMYSLNKPTMTTAKHRPLSASDKQDPGETCKAKGRKKTTKTNKKAPVGRRQSGCCSSCAVLCEHVCTVKPPGRPSTRPH